MGPGERKQKTFYGTYSLDGAVTQLKIEKNVTLINIMLILGHETTGRGVLLDNTRESNYH